MDRGEGQSQPGDLNETIRTAAAQLPAISGQLGKIYERLEADERRLRRVIVLVAALAVAAALAVGILGFSAARQNSDRIAAEARRVYDGCVATNRFRAKDLATWEKVLAVILPPVPAWQAKREQILAAERAKDAPRDCGKLPSAHSR